MNLQKAANLTSKKIIRKYCNGIKILQSEEGNTPSHAMWMLEGIDLGFISGDKGHRWLGYAQAILVMHGHLSLDEAKEINKEASK